MTFTLESFDRNKREAIEQFDQLLLTFQDMGMAAEVAAISEIKKQLLEERFLITVVGEFSRGKSMFINALLGKKVLPSNAVPTTTVLNIIEYAKDPYYRLHYLDPARPSEIISEKSFLELVAPMESIKGNTDSELEYERALGKIKSIRHAEIGYPLEFCRHGVQLLDTPGTNELDPVREQITNRIIPQSDAAILILSAVKILSDSEMSFIRDRLLASDIQKVFIVINFKDQLGSKENEEKILAYARTHLESVLGNPRLYMVSAKEALNAKRAAAGEKLVSRGRPMATWPMNETGLPELEMELSDFLQYDRGAVKLGKPVRQALRSIAEISDRQLKVEKLALTRNIANLKEKVQAFRPNLSKAVDSGNAALRKFEQEMKKEEESIFRWYEQELQALYAGGMAIFDVNRHRNTDFINRAVESGIAPRERELHLERKQRIADSVKAALERSGGELIQMMQGLQTELEEIVGQEETPSAGKQELALLGNNSPQESSFFEDIFNELETAWESRTSVIAKAIIGTGMVLTAVAGSLAFLFNKLFGQEDPKEKLKKQLAEQFNQSRKAKISGFDMEWKGVHQAVRESIRKNVNHKVRQIEDQLRKLETSAGLEQHEIESKLDLLGRQERKLQQIRTNLEKLVGGLSDSSRVGAKV
ncbi:dynamin family protein [Paenibacillus sp. URB8-2]|uniref:dynamin family protein n=1 Tax=Paenibacillus sp. URB8-2 TaxID=2741301 RepID=UPI0015B85EB4|nr:dynamin family protein [Paenibacillus sp. URB8-2]BCG59133.1 dynamin [Paenibacillus sp. URB8-2]